MLPRERVPHGDDDDGQQDELHKHLERAVEDDEHRAHDDSRDEDDGRDGGKSPPGTGLQWRTLLCHDGPVPSLPADIAFVPLRHRRHRVTRAVPLPDRKRVGKGTGGVASSRNQP